MDLPIITAPLSLVVWGYQHEVDGLATLIVVLAALVVGGFIAYSQS
jgi:hypothetical protein